MSLIPIQPKYQDGSECAAREAGPSLVHLSFFHTFTAPSVPPRPSVTREENNFLSSGHQPFRKVLWISSHSPASSRAKPRTPSCSCPGLSVGAATHNQSHHCSVYRRSKVIFSEHTHASVRFKTQPSFFILHMQYNLHGHISMIPCPQQLKGCE